MCGILGRLNILTEAPTVRLEQSLPFLKRRGPDSYATWNSQDGRLELLHVRLAIVDSDPRATQPLVNEERGLALVFNGEIYNYQSLKQELVGYDFKTESDSEVILAVYTLYGVAGFHRLKGMFAFALVDTETQRVILARDAIGKKPLFFAKWHGAVSFGSSLQALAAMTPGRRELVTQAAVHYWKEGFVRPDQTLWEGARPILPGEILEIDWQGDAVSHARHSPSASRIYDGEPMREVLRHLDKLLEDAVRIRFQNNQNPAVLCSGGIDSTLMTMMAARMQTRGEFSRPLKVLTLGSMIPLTNDERYARYAAWKMGLKLDVVRPKTGDLSRSIIECLDTQDEPLGMISFYPLWRLVRAVSAHSKILLSGEGGDEFFMGYAPASQWFQKEHEGDLDAAVHVQCGPSLPPWMSAWGRGMNGDHLVGHSFCKVDRASAEQGVEMRCPFLDWDVVSYARSLPPELLTAQDGLKPLLKKLMAGWPDWFLNRPKMGFTMNLRYLWMLQNYSGLRERIHPAAIETFSSQLPVALRREARLWSAVDIFKNFPGVWKLLAWSLFLTRNDKVL